MAPTPTPTPVRCQVPGEAGQNATMPKPTIESQRGTPLPVGIGKGGHYLQAHRGEGKWSEKGEIESLNETPGSPQRQHGGQVCHDEMGER